MRILGAHLLSLRCKDTQKHTQKHTQNTLGNPTTTQVHIPLWALVHLPVAVTATIAVFTPRGWLFSVLYVLFENAMGLVKIGAVLAGCENVSPHCELPSTSVLLLQGFSTSSVLRSGL